jgi:hypothetical protein
MRNLGVAVFGAALTLFSCSARIDAALAADASAGAELSAAIEPQTAALIRSLAAVSARGAGADPRAAASAPVLDGPALSRSLSRAPGIASANLRNQTPDRIAGAVKISRITDLLNAGGTSAIASRIFRYTPAGTDPAQLAIRLDRSIGPRAVPQLSAEAADYLSALMAPVVTGEALTKTEYRALVASIYGEGIAAEISAAKITVALTLPGQVVSSKGGVFQGRTVNFVFPLIDLLALETPLDCDVRWL